jgi:hypothetical protein
MGRSIVPGSPMTEPREGRYAVLSDGDRWRVLHCDRVIGEYADGETARRIAESLCLSLASGACEISLTVQNEAGRLRTRRVTGS